MTQNVFNTYSRYYDLLYRDKDYIGEARYITSLLTQYGIKKGDLLEFGSGTGKHARLLTKHNYTVHGIELSDDMVAKAEPALGFTCQQGDMTSTTMGRHYDAVLSLFHVVSYLTRNEQLQDLFSNASAHLNTGGLFIFDFWYSPAVYAQKPEIRIKRMMDEQVEITRIAEPVIYSNENCVDVKYTIFESNKTSGQIQVMQEQHPMRHLSLPEIDSLSASAGFKRLAAEEFLTGKLPSEATWGVCVVLKKL
jgi:SAM-dependent methyltransferase